VSGVAAGLGSTVVSGEADSSGVVDPPDPLEPPSSFGQSAFVLARSGRVDGVVPSVVPSVALGAVDVLGSGLAAETTATAPPTSSNAETAATRAVRRIPEPSVFLFELARGCPASIASTMVDAPVDAWGGVIGGAVAGASGWLFGSIA
jgi:hypothetical protein